MCGSPRLLHRGFQLFMGLGLEMGGLSTIARVSSMKIKKPRTKSTAEEAMRQWDVRGGGGSCVILSAPIGPAMHAWDKFPFRVIGRWDSLGVKLALHFTGGKA